MSVDSGVITTAQLSDDHIAIAIVQKQQGEMDIEDTSISYYTPKRYVAGL